MNKQQKIYYNCEIVNNTGVNIEASYTANLLKPLVDNPSNFNINVNRFRLPLNGIPLTENNIPFQQYQVALGYTQDGNTRYFEEYVNQYNSVQSVINNIIVYKDSNNNSWLVKTPIAGNYSPIISLNLGNINPFIVGNNDFIIVASIGSNNITIYDHLFNVEVSMTTTNNIINIALDPNSNDFYVGLASTPFSIVRYQFNNNVWTADNQYTTTNVLIFTPKGLAVADNNLYASNYSDGKVYVWALNTPGNSSSSISPNALYQKANSLTGIGGDLIISYDKLATQTDILYGLSQTNQAFYDLIDNETQITQGQMQSQAVNLNNAYLFAIGTNDDTYSIGPAPFNTGQNWYQLNTSTNLHTLFLNPSNNYSQVYGINLHSLYAWNFNSYNSTYTLLDNNFKLDNSGTHFTSADFINTNYPILTNSDNNLYISEYPLYQRNFLIVDDDVNFKFIGINSIIGGSYVINNDVYSIAQPQTDGTAMAFDGDYYYFSYIGNVNKYDANMNFVSTLNLNLPSIYSIQIGLNFSNSPYSRLIITTSNDVFVYDTNGVLQCTISGLVNPSVAFIYDSSNGCDDILIYNNQNQFLVYSLNNPATPALIQTIPTTHILHSMKSMVGAYINSNRCVYCVSNYHDLLILNFGSNLSIPPSQTIQSNIFTAPLSCTAIYHNSLKQEFYTNCLGQTINAVLQIYDDSMSLLSTCQSGSINNMLPFQLIPQTLKVFNQITSNKQLLSVCASKITPNLLFGVGTDNLVYEGLLLNNTIAWNRMSSINGTYTQISSYYASNTPPNNNNDIRIKNATSDGQITTNVSQIQFLSYDKNSNVVFGSSSNPSTLYTRNTNGSITTSQVISTLMGLVPSKQEYGQAGNYNLWTYQDYLNKMNDAFATATANLNVAYTTNLKAPELFYDATSKLFYLMVESNQYMNTNISVYMNTNLYNMFLFPSIPSTLAGFNQILISDGTSSSTPTYLSIYQQFSSVSKFYDLVRIIVNTHSIPVEGDIEGINQTISLITDVVPDVDTLSPNGLLIYQPTVLRWYNLYSQNPISVVNISFWYGKKDGTIAKVYLPANEYASCKLEFEEV